MALVWHRVMFVITVRHFGFMRGFIYMVWLYTYYAPTVQTTAFWWFISIYSGFREKLKQWIVGEIVKAAEYCYNSRGCVSTLEISFFIFLNLFWNLE